MATSNETPPTTSHPKPPGGSAALPQTPFYTQIDFWAGLVGWYVINGIIWSIILKLNLDLLMYFVPAANLTVLLIAAFNLKHRSFAFGMLLAVALNFLVAIVLGLFVNAICGTLFNAPFFIPSFQPID